jgi:hypothetical protein
MPFPLRWGELLEDLVATAAMMLSVMTSADPDLRPMQTLLSFSLLNSSLLIHVPILLSLLWLANVSHKSTTLYRGWSGDACGECAPRQSTSPGNGWQDIRYVRPRRALQRHSSHTSQFIKLKRFGDYAYLRHRSHQCV